MVPDNEVSTVAGIHVPVTLFTEVVGNVGAVVFWHTVVGKLNAGVICESTDTLTPNVATHPERFTVTS